MKQKDINFKNILQKFDRELFLNEGFYTEWLTQTFFFVRHSTRLLALSAAKSPFEFQTFHQRFLSHAAEEKNHELLLVKDLQAFHQIPAPEKELPLTKSFYRSQYFSIENIHPLSFLGYVYLLESIPVLVGKEILPQLLKTHPKQACSFFKLHCEEDVEHLEKLEAMLNALPQDLRQIIETNFAESADLYWRLLQEISLRSLQKLQAA